MGSMGTPSVGGSGASWSSRVTQGTATIQPPSPESHQPLALRAQLGVEEMKAGGREGTRRHQDADTPGAVVSDSGPHPGEDKELGQEFDCRLLSRQGIITPASSGAPRRRVCLLGNPPAPGPFLTHPTDAPRPSLLTGFPNAFPLLLRSRHANPRCSRHAPGISGASLPRGSWGPSSSPVPMRLVRKFSPVIAASVQPPSRLPGSTRCGWAGARGDSAGRRKQGVRLHESSATSVPMQGEGHHQKAEVHPSGAWPGGSRRS